MPIEEEIDVRTTSSIDMMINMIDQEVGVADNNGREKKTLQVFHMIQSKSYRVHLDFSRLSEL
jgi:hypothetical protein